MYTSAHTPVLLDSIAGTNEAFSPQAEVAISVSDWSPAREPSATTYDALKQAIIDGDLIPGQQLRETELARKLRTSRTPVREALRRLEADGLVHKGRDGLEVRKRSPEEILSIYELRILLEAEAARIAAETSSQVDLLRLESLVNRGFEMSASSPSKDLVALNREFHRAVRSAANNEPLSDLLERLDHHLARYPETTLKYPNRWVEAAQEHADLLDALRKRDSIRAKEIATRHFTAARDIRLKLWVSESKFG